MHNPEPVLENETQNSLEFEIQTDHLISARRLYREIVDKKKREPDFAVPVDHRVKLKDSEKRNKYQDLSRELRKL